MRGLSALGGSSAVSVNQSEGELIAGEEPISRGENGLNFLSGYALRAAHHTTKWCDREKRPHER